MRRKIIPFEVGTITKELDGLPDSDAAKLVAAINAYELAGNENPAPAQIDLYEGGLLRIKHKNPRYQGRALCAVIRSGRGWQRIAILAVFKKEGNKVPAAEMKKARERLSKMGKADELD